MIEYGYINENKCLVSKFIQEYIEKETGEDGELVENTITIEMQIPELVKSGWKPVDIIDDSRLNASDEFNSVRIIPFDNGERISYNYVETFDKNLICAKIKSLKVQLTNGDYKITKCYEASLLGNPLPYDIATLHKERQIVRDKINKLEDQTD